MTDHNDPESGAAPLDAAVEEALPGKGNAEGWRRMHPLSPLLQGGLFLLVIFGIVVANLRDRLIELFVGDQAWIDDGGDLITLVAERGLVLAVLGAVLGVILLVVFFSWLSWRFHTYRITEAAVEARKGLLFRQHRRAPLDRIQSVNLQRPLLARVLGLTKIEVQTAGQGGKVELAYLSHADAKTVREQILRSAAHSRGIQPPDKEADSIVPAASGTEAAPHGQFDQRVQDFADFDIAPEARAAGTLVTVPVGRLIASILLSWEVIILVVLIILVPIAAAIWSWTVLAALLPMLLVMGGIVFGQFNKGFRFTLSRTDDGVRTGSGLTATTTETIPLRRIHAVEVRQPLLWRRLGWWKVRINTAGHSVSQGGQNGLLNVVLPVGFESDVMRVLENLLPGIRGNEYELAALRDGMIGSADGYLGAGPRAGWVLWWGRKRAGIRIVDGEHATLRVRKGVLTRSFAVMPIVRAQSVELSRPFMHRFLGLASVRAHTVLGPIGVQMRGIELDLAKQVFDLLAATTIRVQSADADSYQRRAEQ